MMTYIWYKYIVYEEVICCWLKSENDIEKALAICSLPTYTIFGLIIILLDIICLPFYILIGIIKLILKLNGRR